MKKQISILLAITILVSAAGCGKTVPTEPSGQTTPKTEKQETVDSTSDSSDSKRKTSRMPRQRQMTVMNGRRKRNIHMNPMDRIELRCGICFRRQQ